MTHLERRSHGGGVAAWLCIMLLTVAACGPDGDGTGAAATDTTAEAEPPATGDAEGADGPAATEAAQEDAEAAGDAQPAEGSVGDDHLRFLPADQPPPPRDEVAPGVIVATSVWAESPRYWRIILSIDADGEVVENWRFDLSTATASDDPAISHRGMYPDDFSRDFRRVAATGSYDVEDGPFDTHAGYVTPEGEFVSLAGREAGGSLRQDAEVRFGPDDRLWYWRGSEEDLRRTDLVSVGPDGTDHRHEAEFEQRLLPGRGYSFSQGAISQPYVTHERAVYAVSDDGTTAVSRGISAGQVGPLLVGDPADEQGEPYEGEFGGQVWQFLPGSNDEVVVEGPDGIAIATLDHERRTVSHELIELDGVSTEGTINGVAVGRDGTIAYSRTYRDSQMEYVASITTIAPDRSVATVTELHGSPDPLPSTRVIGVVG